MKMQKIINVIAVSSGVVSLAVVGSGLYVYLQRDQLVDNVKSQVMETILDSLGGLGGGALPLGTNDLAPSVGDTPGMAPPTQSAQGLPGI